MASPPMRMRPRSLGLQLFMIIAAAVAVAQNGPSPSSQNARNAVLVAKFRILGPDVVPFTSQKQNAMIVGVANVLGDGILASDIILSVFNTYSSISANGNSTGNRRLLQEQTQFPGVDLGLNITTSASKAQAEADLLSRSSNQTYQLASDIGAQGLQTQQIALQSSSIVRIGQPPPSPSPKSSPPSPLPPPSPSPTSPPPPAGVQNPMSPAGNPPSPTPTLAPVVTPAATPAATPSPSETASTSSGGATPSSHSSSVPVGAIVGAAAGAVVLVALLLGFLLMMRSRRRRFDQQEDVIDYYADVGKQGSRDLASGGLPVTANSAAEEAPVSARGITVTPLPRQNINEKAEIPTNEKAEVGRF